MGWIHRENLPSSSEKAEEWRIPREPVSLFLSVVVHRSSVVLTLVYYVRETGVFLVVHNRRLDSTSLQAMVLRPVMQVEVFSRFQSWVIPSNLFKGVEAGEDFDLHY